MTKTRISANVLEFEEAFETAEEFLAALHPLDQRWRAHPAEWIFRGHGDTEWQLYATAHRPEAWRRFGLLVDREPTEVHPHDLVKLERQLLSRFFQGVDDAGLVVPGDCEQLRGDMESPMLANRAHPWISPLMALARHHGLPSRLMDWSRQARVAAYFAAVEAGKMRNTGRRLCVIA